MKTVNRIVVFLLALSVFPIMFFLKLVGGVVSIAESSSLYTILSKLAENTANSALELSYSIKEIVEKLSDGGFSFGGMSFDLSKIPSELLTGKGWVITAGILLVIALIIAIVIMGCSLFTKAYKTISCLGATGFVCSFAAMRCFAKFTAPFLNGSIDVGAILSKALIGDDSNLIGTIGSTFLKGAISVDSFSLGNAVTLMMIVFLGIALWELAYFVTLPSSKKNEHQKKSH